VELVPLMRSRATAAAAALLLALLATTTGCGSEDEAVTTTVTEEASGPTGPTGRSGSSGRSPNEEVVAAVETFYRLIEAQRYSEVWRLVPPAVRAESGGYASWKAGYSANVRSDPRNIQVNTVTANRAEVSLDLYATDVDACTGNRVNQVFTGSWTLETVPGGWEPTAISFDKISGETPALSASECGNDTGPAPAEDCTPGYSPCLPLASDYDCEGGGGNGPEYVTGPVEVTGDDPYELDEDGNRIGCE
jgi:hypothetical protein